MRRSLILLMLGCMVVLAGLLQLVNGDSSPLGSFIAAPTPGATAYVSADGCLTCHADRPDDWSETASRRLINSPVADPHAVAARIGDIQHTRRLQISNEASAYPLSSNAAGGKPAQQYVLRTENGTLALPGHWTVDDRVFFSPDPTAPHMNDCAICHDNSVPGSLHIEPQRLRGPVPELQPDRRALMPWLALATNGTLSAP